MNTAAKFIAAALCLCAMSASAQDSTQKAATAAVSAQADAGLSSAQKKRADMLISVFENSTLEPQYAYVENLDDGRGYTAGKVGFCTGTGDLIQVAELYAKARPDNPLSKYMPRLRELGLHPGDSVEGLDGFPQAWALAAQDPLMRQMQDTVADKLYLVPALKLARKLGLAKDLSKIALYEAAIQHGLGDDPDGLPAMAKRATKAAGTTPASGGSEQAWLEQFLKVRRATLAYASDPDTRREWAESVGRADAMLAVFYSGNLDFSGPITITPYGQTFTIP